MSLLVIDLFLQSPLKGKDKKINTVSSREVKLCISLNISTFPILLQRISEFQGILTRTFEGVLNFLKPCANIVNTFENVWKKCNCS